MTEKRFISHRPFHQTAMEMSGLYETEGTERDSQMGNYVADHKAGLSEPFMQMIWKQNQFFKIL